MNQPIAHADSLRAGATAETVPPHRPDDASRRYFGGAAWSAASAAVNLLLPFAVFTVFARLLGPVEVGLIALAVAVSEIVKGFGLPGLYEALLQERGDRECCAGTASATLLLSGIVLYAVFLLLVPLLSRAATDIPGAWLALGLVGLRIPFDLLAMQPLAVLAKRLSYRRMAMRSVVSLTGASLIGLALASVHLPFAGLVAYQTSLPILTLLATGAGALAWPRFERNVLTRLMPETLRASGVRLIAASNVYLDQVVVAGLAGGSFLAYYNLGKRFEAMFVNVASSFASILLQPLFAQETSTDHKAVLHKGLASMTMTSGLMALVVAVNYDLIIGIVFGPTWAEAGPPVALLALSGYARALGSVHGSLLSVSQRNRDLLWVSSSSMILGMILVVLTVPLGLVPCAAVLLCKNCGTTLWMAWLTRRKAPGMVWAYVLNVLAPVASALAGALCVPWLLASGLDIGGLPGDLLKIAVSAFSAAALAGICLSLGMLQARVAPQPASAFASCSGGAQR